MNYQILPGDNRDSLKSIPDNSIDAIVTDPPYGIDFLGKSWDANTGALETYQECLRVLKPGGHILAFSAARTYHHLAITLEQAGFEIRDQIMWIYSSGFPKSQDVGRSIQRSNKNEEPNKWLGWGTALKPAHEPIALARKPIKLSIAKNCQQWGVGALNIDACRVGDEIITTVIKQNKENVRWYGDRADGQDLPKQIGTEDNIGRFPSNVIGEIPDYQKYFYCPKVSRRERHIGFDDLPKRLCGPGGDDFVQAQDHQRSNIVTEASMLADMGGYYVDDNNAETKVNGKNIWLPQTGHIYVHGLKDEYQKWCKANGKTSNVGNNHPTVKPIELMKYLIRLITPPGGTVLDPFNGSGSTGMAAVELGHTYIGCELDPAYVEIAKTRIRAWYQQTQPKTNPAVAELFSTN